MAYTRENLLKRMIDIQEIYILQSRKHKGKMLDCDIYAQLVEPVYRISRKTFYDYLGTNAKRELAELQAARKSQLALFELETV